MTPLEEIKAEIVAKLLETGDGEQLDDWTLHVSNRKWRMAAKELGIKVGSPRTSNELAFTIGKVKVEAQWCLKSLRWSRGFGWERRGSVLKSAYLPSIRQILNQQTASMKWINKNDHS